jgi:hypothetical protein
MLPFPFAGIILSRFCGYNLSPFSRAPHRFDCKYREKISGFFPFFEKKNSLAVRSQVFRG